MKKPDSIKSEIWKAWRIFKKEQKYDTKQNYKKAFKKANTRNVYKKYTRVKERE